jgi:hypothetical protein
VVNDFLSGKPGIRLFNCLKAINNIVNIHSRAVER